MILNRFCCLPSFMGNRDFRVEVLCFLLIFLTVPSSFAAASTGLSARQQVAVAVQHQAEQVIAVEAKQQQWPSYQAKMNLFIPIDVSQYQACPTALIVSPPKELHFDLYRQRFYVHCEGPQEWRVIVTVKPDIYLPVVVAKNALTRGDLLSASDMMFKKLNISRIHGNYLTRPDEVIGMTVKRRIHESDPVTLNQLESPVLVKRGQIVLMVANQGGVEARTMGEAMKKGHKGEMIRVKNESSERVVSAIVAGSGVVKVVGASNG